MSAEDHYIDELERDNRRLTSLVADLRAELAEEKKISAAWCVQAQEAEETLAKREAVAEVPFQPWPGGECPVSGDTLVDVMLEYDNMRKAVRLARRADSLGRGWSLVYGNDPYVRAWRLADPTTDHYKAAMLTASQQAPIRDSLITGHAKPCWCEECHAAMVAAAAEQESHHSEDSLDMVATDREIRTVDNEAASQPANEEGK